MQKEIWKDVTDYEGLYMVSNLGRVKSLDRVSIYNSRKRKGIVLKPYYIDGYSSVSLMRDGKRKIRKIHRLVGLIFISNPNNYKVLNHINHNKADSRASNLEWCTQSHNVKHGAIRTKKRNITKKWIAMCDSPKNLATK